MDVRLLGSVQAQNGGEPIGLGAAKERAVLAMLALGHPDAVSADALIDGLWGDTPPPTAAKIVQHYVWQLRRALGDDGARIVTQGRAYALEVDGTIDAVEFERLAREAMGGSPESARRALALWRSPPLADVADHPFAAAAIRRLEELRLCVVEVAIETDLAAGRHRELVPELDALVVAHPLSERLHAQRVLALYRAGRQADALEAWRHARRTLVDEIGVEPGPELQRLHEAVLRQDPALELPAPAVPRERTSADARASADVRSAPRPPSPPRRRRAPLVLGAVGVAVIAIALVAAIGGGDDGLQRIDEDRVATIDGDGSITAQYAVGRAPSGAVSGDGSVWAASARDRTVTRVDPNRDRVVTIDTGGPPGALAYGRRTLWVADTAHPRVLQVDARVNRIVQTLDLPNVARGLVVANGALWAAIPADGIVLRIDVAGDGPARRIPVGGRPAALAAGGGSVWVGDELAGTAAQIDARSGTVLRTTGVGRGPNALAFAAGSLWVANRDDGTVARLDPRTAAVVAVLRVGRRPSAISGNGKAVWVAAGGDGHVARIDPATNTVTRRVSTDATPTGVAVRDDGAWVAAVAPPSAHRGGTLQVGFLDDSTDFFALDPANDEAYGPESFQVMSLLYDGLVGYRRAGGAAGGELVADLAEELPRPSADGRTYVFRLRRGIRYSDGTALRTGDVRASFERQLRLRPQLPKFFERIRGVRACTERPRRCDLSSGVVADESTRTVTIRLTAPDGELLHKLALPFAYVFPERLARRGADAPPAPGTGPYRVVRLDRDRELRLARNRHFRSWSPDARPAAYADGIVYGLRPRADADIAQVGDQPTAEQMRRLNARYGARLEVSPVPMTLYAFLNTKVPPFDDVRVRRAVNFAVDRERVVGLTGGAATAGATCRMLPPGFTGHRAECPFAPPGEAWTGPDRERARRLVAAAGARGAQVEVRAPDFFAPPARHLTSVLRDLGLRPKLRLERNTGNYFGYIADSRNRAPIGLTAWYADYLAPSTFFGPLFSCAELKPASTVNTNNSQFCDRRLDRLAAAATATGDLSLAAERWDRVERRLAELSPAVPLVNARLVHVLSQRAGNVQIHPLFGALLDQAWVR